jgi:hypothetical protein
MTWSTIVDFLRGAALAGPGVDEAGYGMLMYGSVLVMLEENPDILQPRLPGRVPAPCGNDGWCAFQPDSYVTDGVQVDRRRPRGHDRVLRLTISLRRRSGRPCDEDDD